MTEVLLVGPDAGLIEGLAQSISAVGCRARVACSIEEARDLAVAVPPLVAVVDRTLAATISSDSFGFPLAPGGAVVLYRSIGSMTTPLQHRLQRLVLADLTLPFERNRLLALVQHVEERARAVGRDAPDEARERRV